METTEQTVQQVLDTLIGERTEQKIGVLIGAANNVLPEQDRITGVVSEDGTTTYGNTTGAVIAWSTFMGFKVEVGEMPMPVPAPQLEKYEYGAMSSKYSLMAENKLTAYAAMVSHYNRSAHMIAIYSPEESMADSWLNPVTGQISERLDEIFGGPDSFDKYYESHVEEIRAAFKTIEQIV